MEQQGVDVGQIKAIAAQNEFFQHLNTAVQRSAGHAGELAVCQQMLAAANAQIAELKKQVEEKDAEIKKLKEPTP